MLGGLVGWILGDGMHLSWKLQLGLFLVPTVLYGVAFFGQRFPKSEASAKGLTIGLRTPQGGYRGHPAGVDFADAVSADYAPAPSRAGSFDSET